jgi:hypothetical protein
MGMPFAGRFILGSPLPNSFSIHLLPCRMLIKMTCDPWRVKIKKVYDDFPYVNVSVRTLVVDYQRCKHFGKNVRSFVRT